MTNNKHRHFSLSNGVFTDKKFTRLPPFARGKLVASLLSSATGRRLPPDDAVPFSRGILTRRHLSSVTMSRREWPAGGVHGTVQTDRYKRGGGGRGGWRVSSPSHPVAQDCAMTVQETRAQLAEEVLRKGFSFPPFLFRGEERDEFIVFFTVRGLSKRTFRII